VAGSKRHNQYPLGNWGVKTPTGYRNHADAFKNQCLLVAAVLGNMINKLYEQPLNPPFSKERKLIKAFADYPCRPMSEALAKLVKLALRDLCSHLKTSETDLLPLKICDDIALFYKIQFVVYDDEMPPRAQIFPATANLKLPTIFLFLTKEKNSHCHVDLITNITTFYNTRGFACIACKYRTKNYQSFRHHCKSLEAKTCFACRRILLNENTYTNLLINDLFCNSGIVVNIQPKKCEGCGLTIYSNSCEIYHNKKGFCKRLGFTCSKCNKFSVRVRTKEAVKAHQCFSGQTCAICFEKKDPASVHLCPWKIPIAAKHLTNLSFLHFAYKTVTFPCSTCEGSDNLTCANHPFGPERHITPELGNFAYEHLEHGNFSKVVFYDSQFKKKCSKEKNFLKLDYIPQGFGLTQTINSERHHTRFGKKVSTDKSLELKLQKLRNNENKTVADEFLSLLLTERYRNYTVITTERHALNFVVQAMIANDITPTNPLVKGTATVALAVTPLNIHFVCLDQYLHGGVNDYKKQFDLATDVKFFPRKLRLFDYKSNMQLEEAPEFDFYRDVMDTTAQRLQKYLFWASIKDMPFDYVQSLEDCANSELEISTLAGLNFAKTSFSLQGQCLSHFSRPVHYKEDSLQVVSAFAFPSMPSFMKHTFRTFALPKNVLYAVQDQFKGKQASSFLEFEVTEFLRHKQPNKWTTLYSGNAGQKKFTLEGEKFPLLIADAYNADTKVCFLFNGCYWHSHPECPLIAREKRQHPTYSVRYEKLCKQVQMLLTYFYKEVICVEMLWECEYLELKKPLGERNDDILHRSLPFVFHQLKEFGNADIMNFLEGPDLRPFETMRVRDAFSASLCEAYALKYVRREGDQKRCHIYDVSSLFPFVGITFPMPCGMYKMVLGDDLLQHEVSFDESTETMMYQGVAVLAIVQCRVFPPTNLKHPFLHTTINDSVVGTLCRKCSELCLQQDENEYCQHSELERSFVGTYTSSELAYASALKYKFEYYQLMVYPQSDFFLRKFLTLLGFYKLQNCDFPTNVGTDKLLQANYCKEVSNIMKFKEILGTVLTPDKISPNVERRTFFKSCLNCFLGTFGTNSEKYSTVKFLHQYNQLASYMVSDRLVDMHPVSDAMLRVTLSNTEKYPSRVNNVAVSCFITSLARVLVHKKMQELVNLNAIILRVSCDCIYFVADESVKLPFKISEAFGCYKEEFAQVEGVAQAGLRNVSVLYRDGKGSLKEHLITAGTTLSEANNIILNHQCFEDMIDKLVDKKLATFSGITVTQVRQSHCIKKQKVALVKRQQTLFSKNLFTRRQFLNKTPYYETFPYGWRNN
jgi:hypothetical protein